MAARQYAGSRFTTIRAVDSQGAGLLPYVSLGSSFASVTLSADEAVKDAIALIAAAADIDPDSLTRARHDINRALRGTMKPAAR